MRHPHSAMAATAPSLFLFTACAGMPWAASAPAKISDGVLTDTTQSMTLYTFDRDTANNGKSACNDPCAKNWPPFYANAGAKPGGAWTIIQRDDGKLTTRGPNRVPVSGKTSPC